MREKQGQREGEQGVNGSSLASPSKLWMLIKYETQPCMKNSDSTCKA